METIRSIIVAHWLISLTLDDAFFHMWLNSAYPSVMSWQFTPTSEIAHIPGRLADKPRDMSGSSRTNILTQVHLSKARVGYKVYNINLEKSDFNVRLPLNWGLSWTPHKRLIFRG